MGWIGVDLFFVLSGFLVSGLLFREYIKYGNISARNFLIRRGFKIYPIYYIFYIVYLIPILLNGSFKPILFLSDLVFLQNYVTGWGYAYSASWSLAVEEHFYFALAIVTSYWINKKKFDLRDQKGTKIERVIFSIMFLCLIMRLVQYYLARQFHLGINNFTMTHLRIDSLLAGVLVSYWYHFRIEYLKSIFDIMKPIFLPMILVLISFTPFFEPLSSPFVTTFGFSLLYVAFSLLLIYFLLTEKINDKLNAVFTKYLVDAIAEIGLYSYSIYIIHQFIHKMVMQYIEKGLTQNKYILFLIVFCSSVLIGKIMTDLIEKYFLRIRDKYYPSRIT